MSRGKATIQFNQAATVFEVIQQGQVIARYKSYTGAQYRAEHENSKTQEHGYEA